MRLRQLVLLLTLAQSSPNQTGTIEGIVTQSGTSFPIAGVQIKLLAPGMNSTVSVLRETVSDGAGVFALAEIPPGPYVIEVSREDYVFGTMPVFNAKATIRVVLNPAQRLKVPISGVRAGAIRGRVFDGEGRGLPDMPIEIIQSGKNAQGQVIWRGIALPGVRTDNQGEFIRPMLSPGQYVVRTTLERPDTPSASVYSPGTTDVTLAAVFDLREGSEITADIPIGASVDVGTYKISGKVISPVDDREPVGLILRRRPAAVPDSLFELEVNPRTFADAERRTGKFELRGTRPGIYDLYAFVSTDTKQYLSKVTVEVRNADVDDVELVLHSGTDIKGRLVVDDDPRDLQLRSSSLPNEARDPNRSHAGDVGISLHRTDGLFSDNLFRPEIGDDRVSFTFRDVPQGEYRLSAGFVADERPPSPDLYVADIRAGGRSVAYTGFEVGIDAVDAMEVIVGTHGGAIKGNIQGRPPNTTVLLILAPQNVLEGTTPYNVVPVAPGSNGQFELRGLRPGNYKIFAVPAGNEMTTSTNTAVSSSGGATMVLNIRSEFFYQNADGGASVTVQKGNTTTVQVPFLFSIR